MPLQETGLSKPAAFLSIAPSMTSSQSSSNRVDNQDGPSLLSAWRLGIVALVLFGLFAIILLGDAFPFKPMDPTWQMKMTRVLIGASGFPLVGLALMHLGSELEPADRILAGRRRLCSRLGILATIGFLLLVPLQAVNTIRAYEQSHSAQITEIRTAENNLAAMVRVVEQSGFTSELVDRLKALEGLELDTAVQTMPLSLAKEEIRSQLQTIQQKITRERKALRPPGPPPWLLDVVRNCASCLLLAVGFSALSHRPGVGLPLLMEQQLMWRGRGQPVAGKPGRLASAIQAFKKEMKGGQVPHDPLP